MQHTFLARLFRHSKISFAFVIVFIIAYAFFFTKQMDMVLFSYNGMFASVGKPKNTYVYGVKLDDKLLETTTFLWWKKDFLESGISAYARYIKAGENTYLDNYLNQKIESPKHRRALLEALTPGKIAPEVWAKQQIIFLGRKPKAGQTVEIVQYQLKFLPRHVVTIDSFNICKAILR